jgi:muramoyltetrapeptide carboxypeptidase LdcA involved in peptidoglycan recycling
LELIRAKALHPGDTVGIFTPSSPSYVDNEELFQNGVRNLERLGFKVKIGSLTKSRASQGYRSGTPVQRAQEFMELIQDPGVHGLISTIGGNNSNSLIPYLDFAVIRQNPKVICGYSDVTSLHMAILKYSGLRTFYGPALMPGLGIGQME